MFRKQLEIADLNLNKWIDGRTITINVAQEHQQTKNIIVVLNKIWSSLIIGVLAINTKAIMGFIQKDIHKFFEVNFDCAWGCVALLKFGHETIIQCFFEP